MQFTQILSVFAAIAAVAVAAPAPQVTVVPDSPGQVCQFPSDCPPGYYCKYRVTDETLYGHSHCAPNPSNGKSN